MNTDRDDPILEAYLAEALSGHTPPELTARILQAWAAAGHDPARLDPRLREALRGAPLPPPVAAEVWMAPVAPPVQADAVEVHVNGHYAHPVLASPPRADVITPAVPVLKRKKTRRETAQPGWSWLALTIAAGVLAVGSVGGYVAYRNGAFVAGKPEGGKKDAAANVARAGEKPENPDVEVKPLPNRVQPPVFVEREKPPAALPDPPSAWKDVTPSSDQEMVAFVNATVRASWDENKVTPAPAATDAEWCRRVYVRLLGRAPSAEELAAFTADNDAGKHATLVDRLLNDKQNAGQFASHWATQWAHALAGHGAQSEGLQEYLEGAIRANRSFADIAFDLIAATGSSEPGAADYNPATRYLLANQADKGTLATARTARVFLGKQMACAQCHDDASHGASQQQFWAFNSFFRQMQVERDFAGGERLVNRNFQGESGNVNEADVFYERRDGQVKVAYPEFVDGTSIPHTGLVIEIDRRKELARLVSHSDDLSLAAVNRAWAHFFGYGFTRPVDDMGPHNPATHPELLDRLAREFKAHGYNHKDLLRWIALSEPFSLSSKTLAGSLADAPEMGTPALFSHYYSRPLAGEAVQESLVAATDIARRSGTRAEKDMARLAWLGQVRKARVVDSPDEEPIGASALVQQALRSEHSALLERIARSKLTARSRPDPRYAGSSAASA
jgi:hypothetical protein